MSEYYLLDGHEPVPVSMTEYLGHSRMGAPEWAVAKTRPLEECEVSTVFLSIPHGFDHAGPLLFETMVFGGPLDGEVMRYCAWDEALAGHEDYVRRCQAAYREALEEGCPA